MITLVEINSPKRKYPRKNDQITEEKSKGANNEASANWKDLVRHIWAIKPNTPDAIMKLMSILFGHIQLSLKKNKLITVHKTVNTHTERILSLVNKIFLRTITAIDKNKLAINGSIE